MMIASSPRDLPSSLLNGTSSSPNKESLTVEGSPKQERTTTMKSVAAEVPPNSNGDAAVGRRPRGHDNDTELPSQQQKQQHQDVLYADDNVETDTAGTDVVRESRTIGLSTVPPVVIEPHAASRVVKGEIHNLLTVMRSSTVYVSSTRFHEEFVDLHPLAHRLQELRAQLANLSYYDSDNDAMFPQQLRTYIHPFCEAIRGRDISAAVTGVALSALHKFLLYGFVTPQTPHAPELMTMVAESLVNCCFEEEHDNPAANRASATSKTTTSATGRAAASSHQHLFLTAQQQEEQVVLKLLDLSALTVRCSLHSDVNLIPADLIVGLLETCLHVSHKAKRASPLLKSAAADGLSQMVLQVFSGQGQPVHEARIVLLQQLAHLLKPSSSLQVTNTSLTLINIALETCRERWQQAEVDVLQNDVCKYLLSTSTTHNWMILTLTLRVIFNLFDSLRNHLKVQLEVFLTSVHLRILDMSHSNEEEREVVLESLLEFCQEPALMEDVYLNYDCDVACTNLYECIVVALGKAALPAGLGSENQQQQTKAATSKTTSAEFTPEGSTHQTASGQPVGEGKLTNSQTGGSLSSYLEASAETAAITRRESPAAPQAPLTHLNLLALEGLLAVLESIVERNQVIAAQKMRPGGSSSSNAASESSISSAENNLPPPPPHSLSSQISQEELFERKLTKNALSKVAIAFNAHPIGYEWTDVALQEGQLKSASDPHDVATLLYTAPDLDKVELGNYLSKGPSDKYPFQASVRQAFVALFDFSGLKFAAALRKFLSKFRLPGEAQCIDRLMEAFSHEYYKQSPSIFNNTDAVYVLSFSTIMLNTDLHNPTIKSEMRMTLHQFLRNNRGINGGEDLPEEFLTELYESIKNKQIQMRSEMSDIMMRHEKDVDFRTAWEGLLAKSNEVATPFFTPSREARRSRRPSSTAAVVAMHHVHDKEMFTVLSTSLLPALTGIFLRSWDDALVVKTIQGIRNMAKLAAYLDLNWIINDILQALLPMGRDYIMGCVALDYGDAGNEVETTSVVSNGRLSTEQSVETGVEEDDQTTSEAELPIPYAVLCSSSSDVGSGEGKPHPEAYYGSASHRGILALDCTFVLIRKYGARVTTAWPSFIECLCALRDARALPTGLADLDDFADSNGHVLPLSAFAKISHRRLDEYYRAKSDPDASANKQKGWFRSFFRKSSTDKDSISFDDGDYVSPNRGELSTYAKALLGISEAADVEAVIEMGSTKLPVAEQTIKTLLEKVGQYPYDDDPVLEQHAIFSLELAARALLSNKERAPELFSCFLNQFESILGRISEKFIPAPFVIERIVVTVLRSCIHLYELPELRPQLRASLHLLMMVLPKSFIRRIADRMACGLAIILRSSFQHFQTPNEWAFMGDTLDMLAHYSQARVFVFDGIASTVEYAIVPSEHSTETETSPAPNGGDADKPDLSTEACNTLSRILIRFVLGFYQNDLSLSVPAMLCLEKMYRHKAELLLRDEAALKDTEDGSKALDPSAAAPDKDLWQNFAVAVYSVCRSPDPDVAMQGVQCFERVIINTSIDQIPDEKWIAILYLMVNKQPPLVADESRVHTFSLLGQLLSHVLPELSHRSDNHDDLVDLINSTASLAAENLRQGRRGKVSPLFAKTLQAVTELSNHMITDEWKGETEFSTWASETLLSELEKVGAAGASLRNQAAVAAVKPTPKSDEGATETEVTESETTTNTNA